MEELLSRQQSQQSAIPQNPLNDVRDEPVVGNSGALQDFDSDSVFISDSDGDDAPKPENKPAKSVRVNLETIPVDSSLLRRCLYFSGINGNLYRVEVPDMYAMTEKPIKNSIVRVRKMDQTTYRILQAQHNTARMTWTCASRTCRAEVSVWVSKCEKCQTPRRFAASGVCVGETDWLCAM
ncbi:TPA: hypothetical protein N0F65_011536 [Lagenidium giganteum]|uniref:Uncharacterized protein n=1 Tax=Lagenidium giganteum TaxID=4803 RepID=A0AAV2ZAC2_9STRA|nr:TPA: hypothetical protein N0F65_011536 [Lagenidium giganteum]